MQHYLWKDQTGFLLHPEIPLDGRTDLKIADVGTGTGYVIFAVIVSDCLFLQTEFCRVVGRFFIVRHTHVTYKSAQRTYFLKVLHSSCSIWLLDLARTLPPTAQLDGFDIDISDCPPEQWLPRNIKMRYLNALGDIPAHLVGNYDIVHLRLFQVVVKNNDPGPLLRNMLKMLSV